MYDAITIIQDKRTLGIFFMTLDGLRLPYRFTDTSIAQLFILKYIPLIIESQMPLPSAN